MTATATTTTNAAPTVLDAGGGLSAQIDATTAPSSPAAPANRPATEEVESHGEDVKTLHDLIAGGIAGSASVVVGHPFDTIKVRLQTSAPGSVPGGFGRFATSFGGYSSLFSGIGAPLSAAAVINAIIFASFGASSRLWDSCVRRAPHEDTVHGVASSEGAVLIEHEPRESHYHAGKNLCCGAFAGFLQSFVICPMEHVKCRMQVQHPRPNVDHVYDSSFDAARRIVRSHGVRGLYRGMTVTCWREAPGYALYFASYDVVRDKVAERSGQDEHSFFSSFVAGGVAGWVVWFSTYPFDVVKTRIQTSPFDTTDPSKLKIVPVARALVTKNGWRYLYRGLGITLVRAFPVNAVVFPVYGFVLGRLRGPPGGGGGGTAGT